jgi:hypothetical protein
VLLKTLIDGAVLIILSRLGGRALLGVLIPHALCLCVAIAIASLVDSRLMLAGTALVLVAANLALSLALSAELRDFVRKLSERAGLGRRIGPRTEPLDAEM